MTVFPNVPPAPGVPALNRQPGQTFANVELVAADGVAVFSQFLGPQWGIFDQLGNPVIVGDSIKAFEFKSEFRISDYPVEQGGFASYNKVQVPFDVVFTVLKGGSVGSLLQLAGGLMAGGLAGGIGALTGGGVGARADFLASVDAAVNSLYLFDAVTPEATYLGVNLLKYDYRRARREGATLLTVNIYGRQVRQSAQLQFANTANPNSQGQVNGGTVSPGSATVPAQVT